MKSRAGGEGGASGSSAPRRSVTAAEYQRLLAMRVELRRFLHWSEEQARHAGLTAAQHQLLLAVKGHPGPRGPTIGEAAAYLVLKHHSAVGLIDRADGAGLVVRYGDPDDRRVVRLRLTEKAERILAGLSALHLAELDRLAAEGPLAWGLPGEA